MDIEQAKIIFGSAGQAIGLYMRWQQGKQLDAIEARLGMERIVSTLRDVCFYYMAVAVGGRLNAPSFPYRQLALNEIKDVYNAAISFRAGHEKVQDDPWYDIEEEWKEAINSWIGELNKDAGSDSPYTVALL